MKLEGGRRARAGLFITALYSVALVAQEQPPVGEIVNVCVF